MLSSRWGFLGFPGLSKLRFPREAVLTTQRDPPTAYLLQPLGILTEAAGPSLGTGGNQFTPSALPKGQCTDSLLVWPVHGQWRNSLDFLLLGC